MKYLVFVTFFILWSAVLNTTAAAQLSSIVPASGFYTSSGDCLLTDGSITLRNTKHQMTFHYDLAGKIMNVDVLAQLSGNSPIGGQVWGGKTYYSTPAGMVLDPDSAVYSLESSGAFDGTAQGYYFNQGTRSWLAFKEILCERERAVLLAERLVNFRDFMSARFEIDLLTEFDAIRKTYGTAISVFKK